VQVSTSGPLVYSTLSHDPQLQELLTIYVRELHRRVETLESHVAESDWESVERVARQVKNSAKTYGYREVGRLAARLEATCQDEFSIQDVEDALIAFSELCDRVRAYAD